MEIRVLSRSEQATIASWRYEGRYATYDFDDPSVLERDHWAVSEAGELIGYCCFGAPARVPGATEKPGTLDVGWGLSPERMGQGAGSRFVAAIVAFAGERWSHAEMRVFVLDWNHRSRTVAERNGFVVVSALGRGDERFVVMVRP
jgi:ribosomal-protein-alanine N-acetyltransferase